MLGAVASVVVIMGGGSTHALIPLYAVGVFIDFTISQSGMVRHWLTTKDQGWRYRLTINAIGAVLTAVITVVVVSVKFTSGAWFVLVLIPLLVGVDAVHPPPVRRPGRGAGGPTRTSSSTGRTASSGW